MPLFDDSPDADGYVPLRVAAHQLGEQVQYASRYHTGVGNHIVLSQGLRITDPDSDGNYHRMRIHSDDVAEFVARVEAHRNRPR